MCRRLQVLGPRLNAGSAHQQLRRLRHDHVVPAEDDRSQYRELIDDLVLECRDGQGSVMPGWVRRGVCSTYARDHPGEVPEEDDINGVLKRLTDDDREVVARMLELAYEGAGSRHAPGPSRS